MVDRQDIDALLVGALYGELTPADEARLAAHLESHPADRATLEDLKTARHAVKQSRIFEVQDEPPQAVSALLLQEAHRRAPKVARVSEEREGWFARIARTFFAHPAMAAAAMLVVVVGVAGTLYLKKGGDEFANKETSVAQGAPPATAATDNAPELDHGVATQGEGSAYAVQLDESANREEAKQQVEKLESQRAKLADKSDGDGVLENRKALHASKPAPSITPRVPMPEPKDLAESPKGKAASSGFAESESGLGRGAPGGGGAVGGAMPRDQAAMAPQAAPAPAAPPPPPKATTNAITSADARTAGPAPGKNDAKTDPVTAWAQKQLASAIQYAKNNNCGEAAKIVLDIRTQAPAYYRDNVADNRDLKGCQVYFRPRDEERTKKMAPSKAPDMESMH